MMAVKHRTSKTQFDILSPVTLFPLHVSWAINILRILENNDSIQKAHHYSDGFNNNTTTTTYALKNWNSNYN